MTFQLQAHVKNKTQVCQTEFRNPSCDRVLKCDVIIFQFFSIQTFQPHHVTHTAAVRTWAKSQIARINESEDRDV